MIKVCSFPVQAWDIFVGVEQCVEALKRANLKRKKREELLAHYGSEAPLFEEAERKEELV